MAKRARWATSRRAWRGERLDERRGPRPSDDLRRAGRHAADAARPAPPLCPARRFCGARGVRGIWHFVAHRLRFPRDALGAGAGVPRRRRDLPRSHPRRGPCRQPNGLPAAIHPARHAARAASGGTRLVGLVRPARRRGIRLDADRRRARLALPRSCGHVAGRRARPLLREPHRAAPRAARARVALPRPGGGRGHRGRRGGRREAVRLAARRLAAPDAPLPRRRMGGRHRRSCSCSARGR